MVAEVAAGMKKPPSLVRSESVCHGAVTGVTAFQPWVLAGLPSRFWLPASRISSRCGMFQAVPRVHLKVRTGQHQESTVATIEVGVEEARRKLGELVTAAAREHQIAIITKNGIPAAFIGPMNVFDICEQLASKEPEDCGIAPVSSSKERKTITMTPTLKSFREEADIRPTPEDRGLQLTVTITAYDKGLIQVSRKTGHRVIDAKDGWLGVAEYITLQLRELQRQSAARQEKKEKEER
jgi:prevent-host-death family protein